MSSMIEARAKLTQARDIVEKSEKFILKIHPNVLEARNWLAYLQQGNHPGYTLCRELSKLRDNYLVDLDAAIKAYDASVLDVQYWAGYVTALEDANEQA